MAQTAPTKHNDVSFDVLVDEENVYWSRLLQETGFSLPQVDLCADVTCENPIEGCDPFDGLCKTIDGVVPCIAIIDETDGFGTPAVVDEAWDTFRTRFPDRPFCLLRPVNNEYLSDPYGGFYLPPSFLNDPRVAFFNVSRDDEGMDSFVPGPSDWFDLCGFSLYEGSDVAYIGKFLDVSGSMTLSTVAPSNDLFDASVANAGLEIREVFNSEENWIEPFLTTLVPEATAR
mmetsp:Transcript_21971/g.40974  ORF Transcript_21971/g.40974 Transcript_21971/m.40974 type:complete len:230 (-) Transcript_21971:240-929(-)